MNNIIDLNVASSISMVHFAIRTPRVRMGEELSFTFTLRNTSDTPKRLDIRYEIEQEDAAGRLVRHPYRISNRKCPVGFLLYNHSHKIWEDSILTDSKMLDDPSLLLFPGAHDIPCKLRILVNGQFLQEEAFTVVL